MATESFFKIIRKVGIKGLVLASCVVVGLILILANPTLPMKLLGIGVVILSMIGLVLAIYQSGYVTGKVDIVEERKPSTPLPKNLKIDEISTEKAKIKSFENLDSDIPIELEAEKSQSKSTKKKSGLLQSFINFVAKNDEKPIPQKETQKKSKGVETKSEAVPVEMDTTLSEFQGSFKILRKGKTVAKLEVNEVQSKTEISVQSQQTESVEEKVEEIQQEDVQESIEPIETVQSISIKEEIQPESLVEENIEVVPEVSIKEKPTFQNQTFEVESTEFEIDENLFKGEPIKEMKLLFERMLNVIGSVLKTTTSAFYLVNKAKGELVLQAIVSQFPNSLRKERKVALEGDLVSQIALTGKAMITEFNTTNAELDLLPFYSKPVGAKTFVGVPVKLKKNIIGVLCADSTSSEAFDKYTVNFFNLYSSIFSFFLESYTEKYELLLESRVLGLVEEMKKGYFSSLVKYKESLKNIVQTILNLFDFTTVGLCLYDFDSKFYRVLHIRSKNNLDLDLKNKRVDLKRTLLGKALLEKRTLNVEFDEQKKRVHYLEAKIKKGIFVAVPIKTNYGVYGAIFGWTDDVTPVVNHTLKLLENIAFTLGLFYENDYFNLINRGSSEQEAETERNEFVKKVAEEWTRAYDFGIPFSVCKIAIDNYLIDSNLLQEFEIKSKTVVLENLKKLTKEYDFVSVLEDKTIGVVFVGRTGKDAKLLMEMVRKSVAQTNLKINNENVFFTISCGIAQFSKDTNFSKLMENVDKALEISFSRKNTVTLY